MARPIEGRFRTFKPEEEALARDFLATGALAGDVRAGVPLETERSREVARMDPRATFWTRYPWMFKVDLVIEAPTETWLVELEQDLRLMNPARLEIYRGLYVAQYLPTKDVRLGAVARLDSPEMHAYLEAHGVRVWILG